MHHYTDILSLSLREIDPQLAELDKREGTRQSQKINMIAALSICPRAVREALASNFINIDAEGYPPRWLQSSFSLEEIDFAREEANYIAYDDNRPNRNTVWANIVEVIAQKRLAQLLSTDKISFDKIFANVQPLSGAIANQCALSALIKPGDRVLAMALDAGGHLSHGSPFHTSSSFYNFHHYGVDPSTGRIDYEALASAADSFKPKLIIGGASAYPWDIDWLKLREIADNLPEKTFVLADIAHTAGLVAGGVFPNPIEFADVVTLVTYKTLCGPRGAAIVTTDSKLSTRVNRAVFPKVQSSPVMQNIAAMAVCFKIAAKPEFKELQKRIVANAQRLVELLQKAGLTIAFGGTSTHMFLVDLKPMLMNREGKTELTAHDVARALDKKGIICNKNPLPGDKNLSQAMGLRFGTTWITQQGYEEKNLVSVAEQIAKVIFSTSER